LILKDSERPKEGKDKLVRQRLQAAPALAAPIRAATPTHAIEIVLQPHRTVSEIHLSVAVVPLEPITFDRDLRHAVEPQRGVDDVTFEIVAHEVKWRAAVQKNSLRALRRVEYVGHDPIRFGRL